MRHFLFVILFIISTIAVFAQNEEQLKPYKNEVLSMDIFEDYERDDIAIYDKKLMTVFIKSNAYRYQLSFSKTEQVGNKVDNAVVIQVFYSDNDITRQTDIKKHIKACLDYHKSKEIEWNGMKIIESTTKLHPSYGDVKVTTLFYVKDNHLIYIEFWNFPKERKRHDENMYKILSSIQLNAPLKELYNATHK